MKRLSVLSGATLFFAAGVAACDRAPASPSSVMGSADASVEAKPPANVPATALFRCPGDCTAGDAIRGDGSGSYPAVLNSNSEFVPRPAERPRDSSRLRTRHRVRRLPPGLHHGDQCGRAPDERHQSGDRQRSQQRPGEHSRRRDMAVVPSGELRNGSERRDDSVDRSIQPLGLPWVDDP